jgi:hypothetical protein
VAGCSGRLAQVGFDAAAESLGGPADSRYGSWAALEGDAWLVGAPARGCGALLAESTLADKMTVVGTGR